MSAHIHSPDTLVQNRRPKQGLWKKITNNRFLFYSIAAHVFFGLVASVFVVQSIAAKRKLTFTAAPPSPNPSQKALEHKVQVAKKQNTMSAPAQPNRIATTGLAKVSLPDMPSMPSSTADFMPGKMAGVGSAGVGLGMASVMAGGGGGGGPVPFFGLREGAGFAGIFYDFKQSQDGKPTGMVATPGEKDGWPGRDEPTNKLYDKVLSSFIQAGMSEGSISKYFRGTEPLFTTQIYIPNTPAADGPKAFNLSKKVQPKRWMVVYRGKVTPPESGRYRFAGFGDDILVVRFDGRIVFDGSLFSPTHNPSKKGPSGIPTGEYFEARGGFASTMEVVIGERPGGEFSAYLLLDKEGAKYDGAPKLPIFKLTPSDMPKNGNGIPKVAPDTSWSVWKGQPAKSLFAN